MQQASEVALVDQEPWYWPTCSPDASGMSSFLGDMEGSEFSPPHFIVSTISPHSDLRSSRNENLLPLAKVCPPHADPQTCGLERWHDLAPLPSEVNEQSSSIWPEQRRKGAWGGRCRMKGDENWGSWVLRRPKLSMQGNKEATRLGCGEGWGGWGPEAAVKRGRQGAVSGWKGGILQVDPRTRAKCTLLEVIDCRPACPISKCI